MRNPAIALIPILALALTMTAVMAGAMPSATMSTAPRGTVVETMDGGGYTYLCIEQDGEKRWAAIPKTAVQVGDQVELAAGMEMGQFTSKALDRTFEAIYFCSGLAGTSEKLPHPFPENGKMPPGHGITSNDPPPTATIAGRVAETFDAGGYTYVAVKKDEQLTWVASPPIKVDVGEEVAFASGHVLSNFTSKTLDRTFEAIVFSTGLAIIPPAPSEAP